MTNIVDDSPVLWWLFFLCGLGAAVAALTLLGLWAASAVDFVMHEVRNWRKP